MRRAVGDDYTLMLDSTWAYDYPDGAPGRPGGRGARLLLVRGPAGRRRPLQLRQAQAEAVDPDPRHRVRAGRPHRLRALAHRSRRPTTCAATSRSRAGSPRCVKTAHLAEGFHMNYEMHHGGNSLNNVANLHVIMAIRNCEYLRGAAARRRPEVRARRGHRGRRATASCTRRPSPASAPRSTSR